jgi:LacI family transcriptional regulator
MRVADAIELYEELTQKAQERAALQASRTESFDRCVAVVCPDWMAAGDDEFAGRVMRAIRIHAGLAGWHVFTCAAPLHGVEAQLADKCRQHGADALVVIGGGDSNASLVGTLPVVFVEYDSVRPGSTTVAIDNVLAFSEIVVHLAEAGRTRIAHVTGDPDSAAGRARLRSYRETLGRLGHTLQPTYFARGDFGVESGYRAAQALLALPEPPDAIAAANDAEAVGVLKALAETGLRCPDDIAVTGFDDAPFAAALGLTTVRQPLEELGARAFAAVVDVVRRPDTALPVVLLDAELVVRESSRPAASAASAASVDAA